MLRAYRVPADIVDILVIVASAVILVSLESLVIAASAVTPESLVIAASAVILEHLVIAESQDTQDSLD